MKAKITEDGLQAKNWQCIYEVGAFTKGEMYHRQADGRFVNNNGHPHEFTEHVLPHFFKEVIEQKEGNPKVIGCYGVKKGCAYPNCDCEQPTPSSKAIKESVYDKAQAWFDKMELKGYSRETVYQAGYQQRNKEVVSFLKRCENYFKSDLDHPDRLQAKEAAEFYNDCRTLLATLNK